MTRPAVPPPEDGPASPAGQALWVLLPLVHRMRDAEHGGALADLVDVLAGQLDVLEADLDQFADDQFVETAAGWVVPYLGALVGYRVGAPVGEGLTARAEVANTVAYRRRKGTAAVLEQLARDVTGWGARVSESFERLATTQSALHPRPHAAVTPDLRAGDRVDAVGRDGGAFDDLAHTAEVRGSSAGGRYHAPTVVVALWRIRSMPRFAPLSPVTGNRQRFRMDPLGLDVPLFVDPRTEASITHLAEPLNVPLALRRGFAARHHDEIAGHDIAIRLVAPGGTATDLPFEIADLSDTSGTDWAHVPTGAVARVDPELGRVAFGPRVLRGGLTPWAVHYRGSAVPVGAGEYLRPRTETAAVTKVQSGSDLDDALGELDLTRVLGLVDSGRYDLPRRVTGPDVDEGQVEHAPLVLRAEDDEVPHVVVDSTTTLSPGSRGTIVLDGLLLSGGTLVIDAQPAGGRPPAPRTLVLRACTLVPGLTVRPDGTPESPGTASLVVRDPFATVILDRCVCGPVLAVPGARVTARDSVLDAGDPARPVFAGPGPDLEVGDGTRVGGDLVLEAVTVLGGLHATRLDASDSILRGELGEVDPRRAAIRSRRRQVGGVRFCWLPDTSWVGPRYRCVGGVAPLFTSRRYGTPGYVQLRHDAPAAVRRGASDQAEMGATHRLHAPQREDNLELRLREYLRFGLDTLVIRAS